MEKSAVEEIAAEFDASASPQVGDIVHPIGGIGPTVISLISTEEQECGPRVAVGTRTRVFLIDDHQSYVDALRLFLESSTPSIEVVGTATDPTAAVDAVATTRPDVVLLDMRFPDEDGIKVLIRLNEMEERPRVIILSSSGETEDVKGALFSGAMGYLTKDGDASAIALAIGSVSSGLVVLSPLALRALRIRPPALRMSLTPRQLAVLDLVAQGSTDDEIALEMCVSRATLQRELHACLRTLGARNRTQAVVIAAQCGWI